MRLPPTAFGCTILVLLAASGMAQTPEAVPAAPAVAPVAGQPPVGRYPLPYGLDAPSGHANWTIDTTSPVARQPGERTPYGGETTYIDPACSGWADRTTYAVRVEGALYKLDRARDQPLLIRAGATPDQNATLLTAGNLDYNMEGGMRLTVAYDSSPEEGMKIEATYFGVYDWGTSRTINSANNLQLPGGFGEDGYHVVGTNAFINDYNSAASMAFRTDAQINSVEANMIYTEENRSWAYVGGVRFIRFQEGMYITSRREVAFPPPPGEAILFGQGVSNFNATTNNDLFGIQGGMRMHRCSGPWDLGLTLKAGLYSATVSMHNYVTNANGTVVERGGIPSSTAVAYSGDANVALTYTLRKNLLLTGSYNALWISQIARATDNLDFSNRSDSGTILNRDAGAFLHGLTLGMETRW